MPDVLRKTVYLKNGETITMEIWPNGVTRWFHGDEQEAYAEGVMPGSQAEYPTTKTILEPPESAYYPVGTTMSDHHYDNYDNYDPVKTHHYEHVYEPHSTSTPDSSHIYSSPGSHNHPIHVSQPGSKYAPPSPAPSPHQQSPAAHIPTLGKLKPTTAAATSATSTPTTAHKVKPLKPRPPPGGHDGTAATPFSTQHVSGASHHPIAPVVKPHAAPLPNARITLPTEGAGTVVEFPTPEFIPVSFSRLKARLSQFVSDASTTSRFVEQLQLVIGDAAEGEARKVLKNMMCPDRGNVRKAAECMAHIGRLLEAAEYAALPEQNMDATLTTAFHFDLPSEFDWAGYCKQTACAALQLYNPWQMADEGVAGDVPHYAQRLWIFTRGMESHTKTDLMIFPKIDYVLSKFLGKMFDKYIPGLSGNLLPDLRRGPDGNPTASPNSEVYVGMQVSSPDQLDPNKVTPPLWRVFPYGAGSHGRSRHLNVDRYQRVTMKDEIRSKGLFSALISKLTLKEPVYKDVIVVWRDSEEQVKQDEAAADSQEEAVSKKTNYDEQPIIKMKYFNDIPFGDLNGVVRVKKFYLRPFHAVMITVKLLVALLLALNLFRSKMSGRDGSSIGAIFILIAVVIALAQQLYGIYYQMTLMKKSYKQEMDGWFERHQEAEDEHVLNTLIEEVKTQNMKEILLAYSVLVMNGGSLSKRRVDAQCEEFMRREFRVQMNFDVSGTLELMRELNLVTQNGETISIAHDMNRWVSKYPILTEIEKLRVNLV